MAVLIITHCVLWFSYCTWRALQIAIVIVIGVISIVNVITIVFVIFAVTATSILIIGL